MTEMYQGIPFSPQVALADAIGAADTIIPVTEIGAFPDAPSYATIGTDESAETILYAAKTSDSLSGCTRGVEGEAKAWPKGETIARNFTNADLAALQSNLKDLRTALSIAEDALKGKATSEHKHSADDINSGTLPVERGGTGAATAAEALENLGAAKKEHTHDGATPETAGLMSAEDKEKLDDLVAPTVEYATLTASGWSGDAAPYSQSVSISGMTADKICMVGLNNNTATDEQRAAEQAAAIYPGAQSEDALIIYATGEVPTIDLPIFVVMW